MSTVEHTIANLEITCACSNSDTAIGEFDIEIYIRHGTNLVFNTLITTPDYMAVISALKLCIDSTEFIELANSNNIDPIDVVTLVSTYLN